MPFYREIRAFAPIHSGGERDSFQSRSTEQAQAAPAPFTTYALFYNGEFLTHEILSEKRFEKILEEKGL